MQGWRPGRGGCTRGAPRHVGRSRGLVEDKQPGSPGLVAEAPPRPSAPVSIQPPTRTPLRLTASLSSASPMDPLHFPIIRQPGSPPVLQHRHPIRAQRPPMDAPAHQRFHTDLQHHPPTSALRLSPGHSSLPSPSVPRNPPNPVTALPVHGQDLPPSQPLRIPLTAAPHPVSPRAGEGW